MCDMFIQVCWYKSITGGDKEKEREHIQLIRDQMQIEKKTVKAMHSNDFVHTEATFPPSTQ